MTDLSHEFVTHTRGLLSEDYLPKILRCLELLPEEDLWWRPNEASNSVGNLVLHLAGNARQWIVAGVAGEEDVRERSGEFEAEGGWDAEGLAAHLQATVEEVDRALEGLDPTVLAEARTVQGRKTTGLGAIYHVVEHFSMHTGQILWITKMRTGSDLGFYTEDPDGTIHTHW